MKPERNPTEWWLYAAAEYEKAKKPKWRAPMPSKTQTASQKRLWALCFKWRDNHPEQGDRNTADLMRAFIAAWLRWAQSVPDTADVSFWTLLVRFCEGQGQLDTGSPEQAVRVALAPLPKRAQAVLLHRLMGELL